MYVVGMNVSKWNACVSKCSTFLYMFIVLYTMYSESICNVEFLFIIYAVSRKFKSFILEIICVGTTYLFLQLILILRLLSYLTTELGRSFVPFHDLCFSASIYKKYALMIYSI